jgi:hypothetical protein
MNRLKPEQLERARQLLAHETATGSADEPATTAAGRVYAKLVAQLAPLVGETGVELLFLRSAKLVQGHFASVAEVSGLEGSTKLQQRLQTRKPALPSEAAEALFGTFFTLITTFIGERLTTQVLRGAWPTFEETAPEKTK